MPQKNQLIAAFQAIKSYQTINMEASANICWLASYPKSGNTWVRAIIGAALGYPVNINKLGEYCPSWHGYVRMRMAQIEKGIDRRLPVGAEKNYWEQLQREYSESTEFKVGGSNLKFLKTHHAFLNFSGQQTASKT